MTDRLKAMLKEHEGVRSFAYQCTAGYWTIGVGRNVDENGGMGLSDDEIDYLLENDIARCEKELTERYQWFTKLSGARRDAIISIFFNLGATRFREFKKALAAMALQDYQRAATEFLDSRWAKQVKGRAIKLSDMITTNTYTD